MITGERPYTPHVNKLNHLPTLTVKFTVWNITSHNKQCDFPDHVCGLFVHAVANRIAFYLLITHARTNTPYQYYQIQINFHMTETEFLFSICKFLFN